MVVACNSTFSCVAGLCSTSGAFSSCVCTTGYTGAVCDISIALQEPTHWLAVRIVLSVLIGTIFLFAVGNIIQYWVKKVLDFPKLNLSQGALAFTAASTLCTFIFRNADPYVYNHFLANGDIDPWYDAALTLFPNLSVSFLACAYAILLSHWVHIRTIKTAAPVGWNKKAKIVFVSIVVFAISLGILCAMLLPFWNRMTLINYAGNAIIALVIAVYVITSGTATLKAMKGFSLALDISSRHRRDRLQRLSLQMILVGFVLGFVIIALAILTVLNLTEPLAFIWVKSFFVTVVQAAASMVIIKVFGYSPDKSQEEMNDQSISYFETSATMNSSSSSAGSSSGSSVSSSATGPDFIEL